MRALTIASVVLFALEVRGEVTIVYTTGWPGNEVIYGCPVTYSLEVITERPRSITWEYRAACMKDFAPTSGTNHGYEEWANEVIPGSYEVRYTIVYDRRSDGVIPE